MFFAAAATAVLILQLLVALIAPSSCSSVERDDHLCGQYQSGTWALCDPGRCCGPESYCGQGYEYCSPDYCTFQCPRAPPGGYDQSNYEVTETQGAGTGGGVLITRLVNATLHNNRYFNLNIGGDELVKMTADNASSSSSSSSSSPSSSSSLLSCARSLSRLPLVSRYKYPFAALPAPQAQNNITAATRCGRCLMVN
ncbi:unnamed protein product [Linum tenue]|uniref:Chitin-binding type-1 domain-containing protein n=1 Tax=Linum tenue TaxID=586396 RepID=A0AAV0JN08_9ROSI|nr:unnamed protein product [Linum tenue]